MRYLYLIAVITITLSACQQPVQQVNRSEKDLNLTATVLKDKIKGGWAGQVIGCTFGGPTEFSYPGTMIQDYQSIPWDSSRIAWYFKNAPGLYDDIYMDLTFMEVMAREGINAPATSHALAFANAPYPLWHANQAARYNILNGVMPPASGNWMNNPHSEDIDFQIEADFAGLMSPGMPNSASEICDRIGHIMNYGDGWYGGVYMAAMYSLAFISEDMEYIVEEGIKAIPAGTNFRRCIEDVIIQYRKDPNDWKSAWFVVERNWAADTGCPDGIFRPFNIDARVNSAYVVIGLLYGKGDFAKTLDIATRCGQDSDCNPASAGGILGTMTGYSRIPAVWIDPLKPIEDQPFSFTSLSLNKVYETGFRQALEMIQSNGGKVDGPKIQLPEQPIIPVKLEKGFPEMVPNLRTRIGTILETEAEIPFEGTGYILTGGPARMNGDQTDPYVFQIEASVDTGKAELIRMPVDERVRRLEVCWNYDLKPGKHVLRLKILNPRAGQSIRLNDLITYQKN